MLKRLGIPVLALAALTTIVPAVGMARDRDDHRGGERQEAYRGHDDDRVRDRDWDRDHDRRGWNAGFGFNTAPVPAPAPVANGYYDQYGNWHPYVNYGRYGY
jgi:hypothetical protein